jgi:ABC-type glycerol-3-phosphate transport system permease component
MKPPAAKVIAVFLVSGLCSGLITTFLGLVNSLSLFLGVGLFFLMGVGAAYGICRGRNWLPAAATRARYLWAGATITCCYPIAIYFGTLLAFISEAVLWLVLPGSWFQGMRAQEPMPLMALLMLWGAMIAGFMASVALLIVTDRCDKRVFGLLAAAGVLTTALTLTVYVPVFYSSDPVVTYYRESIYFAVMVPLGDTLFAGLLGYGLVRATPEMEALIAEEKTQTAT